MSGIEDLKKKSKTQLDEMYDIKPNGKPYDHLTNKPEKHLPNNLDNHPDVQLPTFPSSQENIHPDNWLTNKPEKKLSRKTVNQSNERLRSCKMTFNLSEELYKAFNDLYAMRILQGKKTEKSEMLCEAIKLLLKAEEANPQNPSLYRISKSNYMD
jgi:hypothetical protein